MLHWFRKSTPKAEAKSLADPSDTIIALLTGGMRWSSVAIPAHDALSVPAVAAAIRVLAEAAATLDLRVVKIDTAGNEVEDRAHPASAMLRDMANEWLSAFELKRALMVEALTSDAGGFAWVNRVEGRPVEILKYQAGLLSVEYANNGEPTYRLEGRLLAASDVIHLRGPFDRCPLTLAREAIGAARVMERHTWKLFQNGARPGGVIEFPKNLGDEGLKRMKEAWAAAHSGEENAGKTAILWDGASFRPLALSSVDAQFLELRKFQISEIARAFRVPPSMLFELDRATWSNGEQMGREFLTYSLEPWLQALEAAFRRALFGPEERSRYRVAFDRDDLTRADLGERATAYSSLISARIINPNQARRWEGLPPYTEGEAYLNPNIAAEPAGGST